MRRILFSLTIFVIIGAPTVSVAASASAHSQAGNSSSSASADSDASSFSTTRADVGSDTIVSEQPEIDSRQDIRELTASVDASEPNLSGSTPEPAKRTEISQENLVNLQNTQNNLAKQIDEQKLTLAKIEAQQVKILKLFVANLVFSLIILFGLIFAIRQNSKPKKSDGIAETPSAKPIGQPLQNIEDLNKF